MAACGDSDEPKKQDNKPDDNTELPSDNPSEKPSEPQSSTFAKGADVSWVTQLESEGCKFYTRDGQEKECMQLLRDDCGVNAIRLRVWVNPKDGWNGKEDVLVKARRAHALGMRLMIDFHFSDHWADPSQQEIPDAWKSYDLPQMLGAITDHVTDILSALKAEGISPEWVQIGNETRTGMLWPMGQVKDQNVGAFPQMLNAGHDAAKAIFPQTKVVVHVDNGWDADLFRWIFDLITAHGVSYDMIGMSLYPETSKWNQYADNILANIRSCYQRYGKPTVISEIGMPYDQGAACSRLIAKLMAACKGYGYVDGIFYWEPEAPAEYNGGYKMGCFINGTPTDALNPFKI